MTSNADESPDLPTGRSLPELLRQRTRTLRRRALLEGGILAFASSQLVGASAVLSSREWLLPAALTFLVAGVAFAVLLHPVLAKRVEFLDASLGASGALVGTFEAGRLSGDVPGLVRLAERVWARRLAAQPEETELPPRAWVGVALLAATVMTAGALLLREEEPNRGLEAMVGPLDASAPSRASTSPMTEPGAAERTGAEVTAAVRAAEARLDAARAAFQSGELDARAYAAELDRAQRSISEAHASSRSADGGAAGTGGSSAESSAEGPGGAASSAGSEAAPSEPLSPANPLDSRVPLPDHLEFVVRRYFER